MNPALTPILDGRPGRWGVHARNLTTGSTIAVAADHPMPTASAAKQFILLAYADAVAAGALDPDQRIEVEPADHVLGSGVLRYCAPGLAPTLEDLAFLMIIVSDNLATNALLREVGGPDVVNALMDRFGLPTARIHVPITFASPEEATRGDTTLEFATSSARDLSESFALLVEPERVGLAPAAAERCLRILRRQQLVDKLPRHLPWTAHAVDFGVELPVTVYNKTGSYPSVSTDAALFVTADASWSAAVMGEELPDLKGGPDDTGAVVCAEVGRVLWDAWGPTA